MASTATRELPDTASGVLAFARGRRAAADRAEADLLQAAVQWAVLHPAETLDDAESFRLRSGGEGAMPLAGPGAPLIAEFSVSEFAAAVGMGTEAGKYYLGQALELRYRLPTLWARVVAGELAAWKARRVAEATIGHGLTREAAGFVDRHVAAVAGRVRPAQLARLVEEAIARFMPDQAERTRCRAADGRHFDIDHDQVSFAGTSVVHGELDLADALDLDDALRGIATELGDLGCTESLDVRRSLAAGELARRQLTLDLTRDAEDAGAKPVRRTVLHVHLSQAALHGEDPVGRCENTRSPVTADQIRAWCGHHCVFPWCTRPARRLTPDQHPCDCDHVTPYRDHGGDRQTCTCQIAPLCRHHHRTKTHCESSFGRPQRVARRSGAVQSGVGILV